MRELELLQVDQTRGKVDPILGELRLDRDRLFEIRQRVRRLVLIGVDLAKQRIRLCVPVIQRQRPLAQRHDVLGPSFRLAGRSPSR